MRGREVNEQRENVGEGEGKWPGSDFWIEVEPMQERWDAKSKQTRAD